MPSLNTVVRCLKWLKRHSMWVRWAVALSLLATLYFLHRNELSELIDKQPNLYYFSLAGLLFLASITLTFFRWYLLVWAQNFPFRLRDALRLGFIGYACNYVMLGAVGGDIFKAGMIAKQQRSRRWVAAGTVLLDRLIGLLALFMVGAMASLLLDRSMLEDSSVRAVVAVLWGGSVAGLVGLCVMLHPRVPHSRWLNWLIHVRWVGRVIDGMTNALVLYQAKRRIIVAAVGISLIGHFGMLTCFYLCAQALHLGAAAPDYWGNLVFIPGAELASVLVPMPGGVGVLEGAVQISYGIANAAAGSPVAAESARAAGLFTALGMRVISVLIAAAGAGYYIAMRKEIGEALDESTNSDEDDLKPEDVAQQTK